MTQEPTVQAPAASLQVSLDQGPVLLYDGECGVCSSSVQWILRHERKQTLRFAALQSELGKQLRQAAGVEENIDSLLWIEKRQGRPRASIWSGAVIAVLRYVGGPWGYLSAIAIIPRPLRDFGYRLFAKYRTLVMPTSCLIPSAEERVRFLDA